MAEIKDVQGVQKLDEMNLEGGSLTITPQEHEESFSESKFELSPEEFIFPLTIEEAGQEYPLFAHMKSYTQNEGVELFDNSGIKFKVEGREKLRTKTSVNDKVRPFFWKHFNSLEGIGKLIWKETRKPLTDAEKDLYDQGEISEDLVSGMDLDRQEQEDYIRNNPAHRIEEAAVLQGYGNFNIDINVNPQQKRLYIGGNNKTIIKGHVFVFKSNVIDGKETGENEKIKIRLGFKRASEFNSKRYLVATGQTEVHRKSEEWQRIEDNQTILEIGKSELLFAEGYTINGAPCTEDNRKEWIDQFPFWHLQACVNDIYGRGAQLKKA